MFSIDLPLYADESKVYIPSQETIAIGKIKGLPPNRWHQLMVRVPGGQVYVNKPKDMQPLMGLNGKPFEISERCRIHKIEYGDVSALFVTRVMYADPTTGNNKCFSSDFVGMVDTKLVKEYERLTMYTHEGVLYGHVPSCAASKRLCTPEQIRGFPRISDTLPNVHILVRKNDERTRQNLPDLLWKGTPIAKYTLFKQGSFDAVLAMFTTGNLYELPTKVHSGTPVAAKDADRLAKQVFSIGALAPPAGLAKASPIVVDASPADGGAGQPIVVDGGAGGARVIPVPPAGLAPAEVLMKIVEGGKDYSSEDLLNALCSCNAAGLQPDIDPFEQAGPVDKQAFCKYVAGNSMYVAGLKRELEAEKKKNEALEREVKRLKAAQAEMGEQIVKINALLGVPPGVPQP